VSTAVLVTDGEQRAALATVRALGRAGYAVSVCATRARSLAGASRYCIRQAAVPNALVDPGGFRAAVEELITRWSVGVLLPVSEQALRVLLPAGFERRGVCVPFPSADVFSRISDKAVVLEAAAQVGLAVPAQRVVRHPDDRAALAQGTPPFPLAIKPARSVAETDGVLTKLEVSYAATPRELDRALAGLPAAAYPVLLQQRVVGPGIGVFLLIWNDETLAVFAHRRLREKPPSGGVSVYRESTVADPALVAQATALVRRFAWRGPAMVEFKIDRATQTPYVMEVNARLWGSLQLAVDAGVDFPSLLVAAALGQRPTPVRSYRVGVRSRWWWGDVDHLLARLRRSARALALPPDAPSRGRAIVDFLRLWRPGDHNEILRLDDPLPFIRETADWLRRR
jgi:predicted ATP-grasp superfamily ATP-dependent carboligase